jgi:hypothetical protein
VVEVVLVVLTVVAVAAAMAMAPGRLRRARGAHSVLPSPRRTAARRSLPTFLGVCASCLDMIETDARLSACPACGGELSVRRRIRSGEPARSGPPAAR